MSDRTLEVNAFWRGMARMGPYAPLFAMTVIGLPTLSAFRIGLMWWQQERVASVDLWGTMLVHGIRVDLIQIGLFWVPMVLLAPLLAGPSTWMLWRRLTAIWAVAAVTLLIFMEVATPAFIVEYDVRPNRLFVEYLKYPREVASMLWGGFRQQVLGGLLVTALSSWGMSRLMRAWHGETPRWSLLRVWLTWPLIMLLLAFVVRSSLDHRPANPAMFALTPDTMVNSLILNSTWSVMYAVYNMKHEARSSEIYGKMSTDEMLEIVRNGVPAHASSAEPLSEEIPTVTHLVPARRRERPLNLVIIVEESMGATFVESLGGIPVTPELERLREEGWWFENLYATGTRSVRGLEAVVTGFPPTPAQSVVKLSLSQQNFFSLAELLGQQGYRSEFIYGGEAHFDNMRSFFMGNGFQSVVDQNDYENPLFKGSWGVSDEDLFARAHERVLAHHASGQPFFTLVFTSSNHSPFEFPDGRIALHDSEKATENNAVKYADHALGRFFEQARLSDYWKDTLFLVVADHDVRVRGDTLVPIERFHIPGLILGADLEPRRIRTVASQIDLPVTMLSLMGVEAVHPMIGRDLAREAADAPGRAMMQCEQHYAWMEGDQVIVLRPGRPPAPGRYDPVSKRLDDARPVDDADGMARRALAHVLLPSWLYREQRYRLP